MNKPLDAERDGLGEWSLLRLLTDLRFALGDNGKRMQPELVEYAKALRADADRYRWLVDHARSTAEHWGGRWSLVIDGPAPARHDCADALDAAIDAARAKEKPDVR